MTICIVGICNIQNGNPMTAVAIADRMITAGDTEFEQAAFSKIDKLTDNCIAITAGSALAHTELFNNTRAYFSGIPTPQITQVVQNIKENYVKIRTTRAEEQYFKPLGLSVEGFLRSQRSLDSTLVLRLSRQLEEADYGLTVLIAGIDASGAHIHCVIDPGTSECFDSLGYCSIGSGERHADSALITNDFHSSLSLKKALYLIYEAKKRAELAPGVGRVYTDMSIVSASGIENLSAQQIKELEKVYKKHNETEQSCRQDMEGLIQDIPLGLDIKNDKT